MTSALIEWFEAHPYVTFADYMQAVLYDQSFGYYNAKDKVFGTRGDFYTSPGVHSVFAETLASYIYEKWTAEYPDTPLQIIEIGAGDGRLAEGIVHWFVRSKYDCLRNISYCIIERSDSWKYKQQERLKQYDSMIQWHTSIQE